MKEFLFDFPLWASVRVRGENASDAEAKLRMVMDCATVSAGADPDTGEPIVFEATLAPDEEVDLIEVDGAVV